MACARDHTPATPPPPPAPVGPRRARCFDLIRAHWNDPQRARLEPRFGWLMNRLPEEPYPDTYALKCQVHQRPPGQRPLIVVEPTDHPLAIDQCRGVTAARAEALAIALLAEVGGGPA